MLHFTILIHTKLWLVFEAMTSQTQTQTQSFYSQGYRVSSDAFYTSSPCPAHNGVKEQVQIKLYINIT